MIKIAIIDDNNVDIEQLESKLDLFYKANNHEIYIEKFNDGLLFLDSYKKGKFDLIFLDVEMPKFSGFETAKKLREIDDKISLIFVTNMSQLARQGYQYDAFDYILKPADYNELFITLSRANRKIVNDTARTIILQGKRKEKVSILISDITYIDVNGHYITFHTKDNEYIQYGVFKKVLEELKLPNCFSKCNRCFVVNMSHIDKIYHDHLVINDTELLISRPQKKAFLADYSKFISGGK